MQLQSFPGGKKRAGEAELSLESLSLLSISPPVPLTELLGDSRGVPCSSSWVTEFSEAQGWGWSLHTPVKVLTDMISMCTPEIQ